MYKSFYGLKESPFNVNPDPRYLFLTKTDRRSAGQPDVRRQTRKGFILLSGEVGTGKTTLINRVLDWLASANECARPVHLQFPDEHDAPVRFHPVEFEIPCDSRSRASS